MITGDELVLSLGQVKGRPVGLGNDADNEDHCRQETERRKDKPVLKPGHKSPKRLGLFVDDVGQPERTRRHHDGRDADPHPQLVADQLSRGPETAHQRIFVVTGIARNDDPIGSQRADREDIKDADIHIRNRGEQSIKPVVGSPRERAADRKGRKKGQRRRDEVDLSIHSRGRDVFLEKELNAVGNRLQEPKWADAIRPDAVLHPAQKTPLPPDEGGHDQQDRHDEKQHSDRCLKGRVQTLDPIRHKTRLVIPVESLLVPRFETPRAILAS